MGNRRDAVPVWRFISGFVFLAMAVPLVPFAVFGELPGESWVEHPSRGYVFGAGVVVLAGDVFLPVPSSVIAVFLGARLGALLGAIAIMLGLTLGTFVGYAAGWYLGFPLVARFATPAQRALVRKLEGRLGYLGLAMIRSIPVLSEASVLAAGAARWSPRPVLAVLIVANGCLAAVYGLFGAASLTASSGWLLFAGGVGVPVLGVLVTLVAYNASVRIRAHDRRR